LDKPDAQELSNETCGRVIFDNVSFAYDGSSDEPVLHNINLAAEPGETVAILGATGSGKTSLVNLIPRFYDVGSGRVTIDGHDLRDLEQDSLLTYIGVVPQETVLFTGTVRDNIRYGRPEASDEEVVAAAKAAQAHEFIIELPDGYDSHVEQRGMNFSGGQKQRLAIARALLMDPAVLILDDSTSSVDVETETHLQEALEGSPHKHTSFVVAQRISTVLKADKIIVLDQGKIMAQGTHKQLLESSPIYREIYDSQLGNGSQLKESQASTKGVSE
jgi:ATP-binding cassette subfamily B protein